MSQKHGGIKCIEVDTAVFVSCEFWQCHRQNITGAHRKLEKDISVFLKIELCHPTVGVQNKM